MKILQFILLGVCLIPWSAYAQVASQTFDPSIPNQLPSAAGFSRLDGSGEPDPKQAGVFGFNRLSGGGAAGDDALNWSTKGYGTYLGSRLGPVSFDLRTTHKTTQITRILGGVVCGQIDEVLNCGAGVIGDTRKQVFGHQHLDLAVVLGPLSLGARVGSETAQVQSQGTLKRSLQGLSGTLRFLDFFYVSSGREVVSETPPGYKNYQWGRQLSAAGFTLGSDSGIRFEIASGKSEQKSVKSGLGTGYWQHSAEKIDHLTVEIKLAQLILGVDHHKIDIPRTSSLDPEARATQIKGIRGTWAYPEGFNFTFKRDSENYTMGTEGDNTEEGSLTTLSLGGSF